MSDNDSDRDGEEEDYVSDNDLEILGAQWLVTQTLQALITKKAQKSNRHLSNSSSLLCRNSIKRAK